MMSLAVCLKILYMSEFKEGKHVVLHFKDGSKSEPIRIPKDLCLKMFRTYLFFRLDIDVDTIESIEKIGFK